MDNQVRLQIAKKLLELREDNKLFRHLHGLPYFVLEAGQYRVTFVEDNSNMVRTIVFIGDHKEYEKWYSQLF